ncbi:A-kinase anchor inhibitor 1 [Willisornis vidua]|uniref:A-kinase anchor inhibitor 1 n=1 Tax=Willisornis vidua TaxID=1566151 RepID=A0ABQ9DPB5_9PASS|nr:A-kinase anchor inhibitor 1 [Willisornis vidua]
MVFAPGTMEIPVQNAQIQTIWRDMSMNEKIPTNNFTILKSSPKVLVPFLSCLALAGEKPGTEQDEVKLQNASKQIVQTAILRAVQQVSQESQQKEKRRNSGTSLQLERGKLTKKHEKK